MLINFFFFFPRNNTVDPEISGASEAPAEPLVQTF